MRLGQKNGQVRQWATRGTRSRQPADQRYESAFVFAAVCPERDTGAAIVMPQADTNAMQEFLAAMTTQVAPGARAILILDQAAWHTTKALVWPENITPIPLPPRSPELNPQENIWQYLRQTWLANRIFETDEDILEAACDAWNRLIKETGRIKSIATRQWAKIGG